MAQPTISIYEYNDRTVVYVVWTPLDQMDHTFSDIHEARKWLNKNYPSLDPDRVYRDKYDKDFA